jgi:hypothetical protein
MKAMRIREEFDLNQLPFPKAVHSLESCDSVPLFHEKYGVWHPRASYNVSLSTIASRISTVLKALTELHSLRLYLDPRNQNWEIPILEATDHMLDALMEHFDDCNKILKSLFPDPESKECKKTFKQFKEDIQPYRDHVGKVVNFIKHNQGCLRIIIFYWETGIAPGYFVEGPIAGGGIGPSPLIHPNSNTAFSFNYDLSFHICNIYVVSDRLSRLMETIDSRLAPIDPKKATEEIKSDWKEMIVSVSGLPHIYFPDEIRKPIPLVSIMPTKIIIEYPSLRAKPKVIPNRTRIQVNYRGDGITKTFKLPYSHI